MAIRRQASDEWARGDGNGGSEFYAELDDLMKRVCERQRIEFINQGAISGGRARTRVAHARTRRGLISLPATDNQKPATFFPMSLALPNLAPQATPDWRSLIPVADAARLLDLNPGHLARTCGEKLAGQGMAFFTKKPHSLGNPQWFVHRSFDPRLTPGPIGDDYAEPDLSSYPQRQRTEALNRRAAVETWNIARTSWNGSIKQIESAASCKPSAKNSPI